jgi:hypothetical protein
MLDQNDLHEAIYHQLVDLIPGLHGLDGNLRIDGSPTLFVAIARTSPDKAIVTLWHQETIPQHELLFLPKIEIAVDLIEMRAWAISYLDAFRFHSFDHTETSHDTDRKLLDTFVVKWLLVLIEYGYSFQSNDEGQTPEDGKYQQTI